MDANKINEKLESVYRTKYKKIVVGSKKQFPSKMRKETGVELQRVDQVVDTTNNWKSSLIFYDEYFKKGNIRVLFVVADYLDLSGEGCNKKENALYAKALWSKEKYGTLNVMYDINSNINEGENYNYLCTNLFKIGAPDSPNGSNAIFQVDVEVFKKELYYSKPDFVIFFTGKKNDKYISQIYGESSGFFPNDECGDIAVMKCNEDLDYKILRLPIPLDNVTEQPNMKSVYRSRMKPPQFILKNRLFNENIVDIVTRIILHTNYSYINKLKSYNEKHRKDKTAKLQNS